MLSPFQIRNLRPSQPKVTQDSLVRISAPGYDKTIGTNPAAKLKYQDEDDGALITVGSSMELAQRLEEPVPPNPRHHPQSSGNPMSIATLLSGSQQSPPSLTHHVFDIEDREEVRKLWQQIQEKNNTPKPSVDASEEKCDSTDDKAENSTNLVTWIETQEKLHGRSTTSCRLQYDNCLDQQQRLEAGKDNEFVRAYDRLRSTIWAPIARDLGISWREAEMMHWSLGRDVLSGTASQEKLEPLTMTHKEAASKPDVKAKSSCNTSRGRGFIVPSREFSDYRALHFKATMPPQLKPEEPLWRFKTPMAIDQTQSSNVLKPTTADAVLSPVDATPAPNLTNEGKRQAQAAGDKLRARTTPSRHRKIATAIDQTSHQNRWANYKSPSSAFPLKDSAAMSQGFNGPSLTSEGKRQAQVAGDKLRNRTNPIRHSRPSRGSLSENGISKNRWSSYGPRITRFDEKQDSEIVSQEKPSSGNTDLQGNSEQPSLLEVFEAELAKNMSTAEKSQMNALASAPDPPASLISDSEPCESSNNSSNPAAPAQSESSHQETNPLLDGLRLINDHLQGLTVGDEDLPQELPKAIGQGFRAAVEGLSTFMKGVTSGLQEASTLTRQAADRTRDVDLRSIDDTILGPRNVAGEVTALGREIFLEQPKSSVGTKDQVCSRTSSSGSPATTIPETDNYAPSQSKAEPPAPNFPAEKPQASFASKPQRPVSLVKSSANPKVVNIRQVKLPDFASDIPITFTRSTRSDNRRSPRNNGMSKVPRYHKPGPIHLPHHSPLIQPAPTIETQASITRFGYVDHLRSHQSAETIEEPDSSQSTTLPAAATRFPTLAQFEGQNFASATPFPPLPSMDMKPLVPLPSESIEPLSANPQSESKAPETIPLRLSKDQAKNGSATSRARTPLGMHETDVGGLSKSPFESFLKQNPSAQQKAIQNYAQNVQRQRNMQTAGGKMPDQSSPAVAPCVDLEFTVPENHASDDPALGQTHGAFPPGVSAQDYQMQLMLLEQQNKRRIGVAREEQERLQSESVKGQSTSPPDVPFSKAEGNNALQDYQMQLMLLEQQNKKRLLLARREWDLLQPESAKSQSTSPLDVPIGKAEGNHLLQDYETQLKVLEQQEQQNKKGLLMARQEPGQLQSESAKDQSNSPPDVPFDQAGGHHGLQDYQMQLMLLEQQNKKRLCLLRQEPGQLDAKSPQMFCCVREEFDTAVTHDKAAKDGERYQYPDPRARRPESQVSGETNTCPIQDYQVSLQEIISGEQEEERAHKDREEQIIASDTATASDSFRGAYSSNPAEGADAMKSFADSDKADPLTLQHHCTWWSCGKKFNEKDEAISHWYTHQGSQYPAHLSSAARLAEPFDPLEAEPSARPHLTEGIRRNATVAGTDSRHNARRRRPYSEAFDGNGRVGWDEFLRDDTNPQPTNQSCSKDDDITWDPPVHRERSLGSRFSFGDYDGNHEQGTHVRGVSPVRFYDAIEHEPARDSRPNSVYGENYTHSGHSRNKKPRVPRSPAPAPPVSFENWEQKRKIYDCVRKLQDLGFSIDDNADSSERLLQYASATRGELVEAIDMIDEEQRAYKEREAAPKITDAWR